MWNTRRLHGLTPTDKSPTSSLDCHHHKYGRMFGWRDRSGSGEVGRPNVAFGIINSKYIHAKKKKQWRSKQWHWSLLYITFREHVLFMLHSWKKYILKSELHKFFPGLFDWFVVGPSTAYAEQQGTQGHQEPHVMLMVSHRFPVQ